MQYSPITKISVSTESRRIIRAQLGIIIGVFVIIIITIIIST